MNKEKIIDYLEKRYKHTGDSDLKISINAINKLQQELNKKNKTIDKALEYIEQPYEYQGQAIVRLEIVKKFLKGEDNE